MNNLQIFMDKQIISNNLDEIFRLIALLKIPKYCEDHDGNTFVGFIRLEKPNRHSDAAIFFNSLTFNGRKLVASVINIRSEDGQWYRANNHYK
ncbi:unnamed protein product [Brachionus calyciflorus]|uniref:Uncharacterized protein n=1 Tax=Brachionus calyciflorus TaxID=104777 RepID=A0A814LM89_9BILA|nr:unnamed protein product [Brachionus calyciflorus]